MPELLAALYLAVVVPLQPVLVFTGLLLTLHDERRGLQVLLLAALLALVQYLGAWVGGAD